MPVTNSLSAASIAAALGFTPASRDVGLGGIGCYALIIDGANSFPGQTINANNTATYQFANNDLTVLSNVPNGVWRNVGAGQSAGKAVMFQRIS